jgi:2-haloacid dehalogenase
MSEDRAQPRRPGLVLFDVFETLLRLGALRDRFTECGRPGHELDLFFARTLRDGMAFTLAGDAPPFAEVARAQLHATTGFTLSEEQLDAILAGFAQLPVHADVEPALRQLDEAGVPAYAFTHGSAATARAALDRAGVLGSLRGVLSAEEIHSFKPPRRVYHWACERAGSAPERTALVAAHSWDTHGAVCAGLLAGFVTRLEGRLPDVVARPHVVADRLDDVVSGLLALPDAD